jgi:HEAT repeat protein
MEKKSYQKVLPDVIALFRDGNHQERHQALIDLALFPFDDIRDVLFEALKDNNHRIRGTAAKMIGKMGDETIVPPILHLLYEDSWITRSSAQEALAQLPSRIALPAFRGILSTPGGDVVLRKNIAGVLSRYENPEAAELLVQIFLNSTNDELRTTVVEHLGRRKEEMAIKTLFDALGDETWNVRTAASKALVNMDAQAILDRAKKALPNPNRLIHLAVVEILIRHGNDDVIDSMASVLEENNPLARLNAVNVLAGINTEESLLLMVTALGDTNSSVRHRAIEALAASNSSAVFQLLKRCVKSENWNLRQGAIKALGTIGSDEAIDILENQLLTGPDGIKISILEALAKIGSNRCVRLITQNISNPQFGEDVIRVIKLLDPDQAINHLISFLTEAKFYESALSALSELERSKVLRYLASRVAIGTPNQQIKAVEAMGRLGGKESEQYLLKLKEGGYTLDLKNSIDAAINYIQKKIK